MGSDPRPPPSGGLTLGVMSGTRSHDEALWVERGGLRTWSKMAGKGDWPGLAAVGGGAR